MVTIKAKIGYGVIGLLLVITSCFIIFHIFFMKVSVTSGSMEPTIMTGDHLIIKKTKKISRGDIVCFKNNELGSILIKRLIGMPGDKITIDGNTVYINGEAVNEDYVSSELEYMGQFDVPDNSYFFLGDNRDSYDARFWLNPYIHKSAIIGKLVIDLDK